MTEYTKKEILDALDNDEAYNFFLDLEHGYFHTAGSRINLFADDKRWAIVFEKSGFGNRSGRAEIEMNYFGNCLCNLDKVGLDNRFTCNSKYIVLISGDEFKKIEDDFELVSKEAVVIKIRNDEFLIEQDLKKYKAKGIEIQNYDNPKKLIDFQSLVRYLDEEYPDILRANKSEIRTSIPEDLPYLLNIDEWHHKSYSEYGGVKPSNYETFQMIAEVLVSRNIDNWKPTLKSNNNWRNWPEAGGL